MEQTEKVDRFLGPLEHNDLPVRIGKKHVLVEIEGNRANFDGFWRFWVKFVMAVLKTKVLSFPFSCIFQKQNSKQKNIYVNWSPAQKANLRGCWSKGPN